MALVSANLTARFSRLWVLAISLGLAFTQHDAQAHGGVVEEADLCVIKIGYMRAHFKIYQPLTAGRDEYCEDLPNATESIFVMEYLHNELARAAIDFRIINDVTGKGRFARWEDVAAIKDLDSATVFYHESALEPDVFTVIHTFEEDGDYIGIVSVKSTTDDRLHIAVFPFEVGFTGLGYWPVIVGLLLLVQLQYLIMSGRIARWRAARRIHKPELNVVDGGVDDD